MEVEGTSKKSEAEQEEVLSGSNRERRLQQTAEATS